MAEFLDLTGYENEHLKVLNQAPHKIYSTGLKAVQWDCECKHCGKTFQATSQNIKKNKVKSCGCYTFELKGKAHRKHGMFGTRLYLSWAHMISRCYNKNVDSYERYGGRGITVCEEWRNEKTGFQSFAKWSLENGYEENLTIDRINTNGNYEPSNCRWATYKEQVRNRRNTIILNIDGIEKPLSEWCEIYNTDYSLVHKRIFYRGWDAKRALTEKNHKRRK